MAGYVWIVLCTNFGEWVSTDVVGAFYCKDSAINKILELTKEEFISQKAEEKCDDYYSSSESSGSESEDELLEEWLYIEKKIIKHLEKDLVCRGFCNNQYTLREVTLEN